MAERPEDLNLPLAVVSRIVKESVNTYGNVASALASVTLVLSTLPRPIPPFLSQNQLPDDINVSKEARQAISKAASVFVLYATSCANNFALKGKRKTLAANDIFQAMGEMEFERFVPELKKSWEGASTYGNTSLVILSLS